MTKLCQHRDALLDRVAAHLVDRPYEHLCFSRIAEECDVSLWALRYNFGNADRLFRAMASHLIDKVVAQAPVAPPKGPASVMEALLRHARALAGLMESEDYRRLAYFVLRNGGHHSWLETAYEERMTAKLCADIEEAVLCAGERRGETILMRSGAAHSLFKSLETSIVLARLLPARGVVGPDEREDIVIRATRQAFASTYIFDWAVSSAA